MSTKEPCRGLQLGLAAILCVTVALPASSGPSAAASEPKMTQNEINEAPSGDLGFLKTYEEDDERGRFRVHSVMPGGSAEHLGIVEPDDTADLGQSTHGGVNYRQSCGQ